MLFSRRLTHPLAHLVFVLFVGLALAAASPNLITHPTIYGGALLLGALVAGVGTFGWHLVIRRGSAAGVYGYFTVQIMLITALMLWELQTTPYGPNTGLVTLPFVAQLSVLPRRWRYGLFAVLLVVLSMLFTRSNTLRWDQVIPIVIGNVIGYSLVLFFAGVLVGEERALSSNRTLVRYAAEAEELATLRERNRLAREIHDNLGHYLTTVNMQIEAGLALLERDPARARDVLTKAQTLTREGLGEVRRSIQALRANPLEGRALPDALLLLVEEHRAAGYPLIYDVQGQAQTASPAIESALYRAAQEGLTNIRKYAGSAQAHLCLDYRTPQRMILTLHDNGAGSASTDGGYGLIGMRERAALLGGTLTVQTAPGQGFHLSMELPR